MNMQRIITGVAVGLPLVLSIHKCLYTGETVDDTLAADVLSLVSRTIWRLYTDLAYLGWGRLYGRFK
jgi:hypothetical protein